MVGSVLLSPGSVQKSSACLGHQYSYKLLHCSFFQCYPAGVLFCAAYYLGQVGFPVSSAEFKPSEKLSTDGVHLRYRIPVQFKGRLGLVRPASNLQVVSPSPAAKRPPRQLPPSRAVVGVVCPLVSLEVVLHHVAISLLFDAI